MKTLTMRRLLLASVTLPLVGNGAALAASALMMTPPTVPNIVLPGMRMGSDGELYQPYNGGYIGVVNRAGDTIGPMIMNTMGSVAYTFAGEQQYSALTSILSMNNPTNPEAGIYQSFNSYYGGNTSGNYAYKAGIISQISAHNSADGTDSGGSPVNMNLVAGIDANLKNAGTTSMNNLEADLINLNGNRAGSVYTLPNPAVSILLNTNGPYFNSTGLEMAAGPGGNYAYDVGLRFSRDMTKTNQVDGGRTASIWNSWNTGTFIYDEGTHSIGLTFNGTYGDGNGGGAALFLAGTYKSGAVALKFPNGVIDSGGSLITTGLVRAISLTAGQTAGPGDINDTNNGSTGYSDTGTHTGTGATFNGVYGDNNGNGAALFLAGTYKTGAVPLKFPNGTIGTNGAISTTAVVSGGAISATSYMSVGSSFNTSPQSGSSVKGALCVDSQNFVYLKTTAGSCM